MCNAEENALFVELEKNIADEAAARMGYYELLVKFSHLLDDQEIEDFQEIIAEELKHTKILEFMIRRRNGIIPEN